MGPLSGAASPSLVARPKHTPRLACEIVREMREMAGCKKTRPPAPPACGLWQGFKKSGGSTGSKEHVCVSPSSIPRSASPRDKADTPPPASPISARPNTPFLALPKAFLFRTLRPSSTSIARGCRRFLGACKRASGLRRLNLLACLQVPRKLWLRPL